MSLPVVLMVGCASVPEEGPIIPEIHDYTKGPWTNRFAADPDLAGVVVQQFPDCPAEAGEYEGRHPAMVLYVFSDGRVCQNCFAPDGTITEDFWWHVSATDPIWERMTPAR